MAPVQVDPTVPLTHLPAIPYGTADGQPLAHLAALAGVTGDLASLEGTSGSPAYSSSVQAVIMCSGPTDFFQTGGNMRTDGEAHAS